MVIRVSARFEEIDLVAGLTGVWLRSLGLAEGPREDLLLAVRETVANAVLHGSERDPQRVVGVRLERRNNDAVIRVKDEGGGFDLDALPDPLAPENLLRPSGRGILLMRAYADDVEFTFGDGTEVELRKRLPAKNGGGHEEEE